MLYHVRTLEDEFVLHPHVLRTSKSPGLANLSILQTIQCNGKLRASQRSVLTRWNYTSRYGQPCLKLLSQ
ncbi:hypothetical protein B0I35DRAFT_176478 [Stachybotrys elegans]|uniref:Uncharacterized protein n=1 Tax=Stachybotrys elegans TaxID=80388 RepID=A0A8K0SXF3_9HYPO|nr:hypothetical protein B0I35DRAFT_176478 [Stachybotrys elegans]